MTAGAVVALLAGTGAVALTAYHLLAQHDAKQERRRRLARAAQREGLRQEFEQHPVERPNWEPYRSPKPSASDAVPVAEVNP